LPVLKLDITYKREQLTDEEMLVSFRQHEDLEILGILYKRYMHLVYGVCMKYYKNREDSQDGVAQIFEVLVRDIPKFEILNFKSWLYAVTRNHCLMKLRKDKQLRNSQDINSSAEFVESTMVMHPLDEPDNDEMIQMLAMCMEQLNSWQRCCVELFYYEKKCYREIAADLKLDVNKVKSHLQNGKRNLKICLEKKEMVKNV